MESGFGSDFGGAGAGGKLDPGVIMEQVKVQIAVANAQELLQVRGRRGRLGGPGELGGWGLRTPCPSPEDDGQVLPEVHREAGGLAGQLGAGETRRWGRRGVGAGGLTPDLRPAPQKCIAMCMDRYMDAWNTVSRAYNSRLQRERANM